jgi:hypothetical protein
MAPSFASSLRRTPPRPPALSLLQRIGKIAGEPIPGFEAPHEPCPGVGSLHVASFKQAGSGLPADENEDGPEADNVRPARAPRREDQDTNVPTETKSEDSDTVNPARSEAGKAETILEDQAHGWEIFPRDENGTIRGGIRLGQLRVWIVPREKLGLVTKAELGGGLTHPGLYILLNRGTKLAYVGESHDLQSRLTGHAKNPPKEQGDFEAALILNDGRNSAHSVYNEHTLRQSIEQSIVALLSEQSTWKVSNKVKGSPPLSISQRILLNHLNKEVAFALYQLRILDRLPEKGPPEQEVSSAEVPRLIPNHRFEDVAVFVGRMDSMPIYFRPGADKHKVGQRSRWQVTIPYGESLGIDFKAGSGFLCFNRGPVYVVPLAYLREKLRDNKAEHKVDIFFDLERDSVSSAGVEPFTVAQFKAEKLSKE